MPYIGNLLLDAGVWKVFYKAKEGKSAQISAQHDILYTDDHLGNLIVKSSLLYSRMLYRKAGNS